MVIWGDKIDILIAIWGDRYPSRHPRRHSLIEKLLCSVTIGICLGSLANLKDAFPSEGRARHLFMDLYVLAWVGVMSAALFSSWFPTRLALLVALYRVIDIVSYRVFFLLIKSQAKPWAVEVLRRSVAIAVINFYEVVLAFALVYLATGCISATGISQTPISSPGMAFYYSLVTMLTVGYGDYVPMNSLGRALVVAQLSTMVLFLIFLLPALVSVFSPILTRQNEEL